MARLTVEDCLAREGNHFALVVLVTARAKQLARGATSRVVSDNRVAVVALREIAAGRVRFNERVSDVVGAFVVEEKLRGARVHAQGESERSGTRPPKPS